MASGKGLASGGVVLKIQPLHIGDSIAWDTPSDDIDRTDNRIWLTVSRIDGATYFLSYPDGAEKLVPIAHKDLKFYTIRRRTDIMVALNILGHLPRLVNKWRALAREKKMQAVDLYLGGTDARTAVNSVRRV